jgi:hypothetical protein
LEDARLMSILRNIAACAGRNCAASLLRASQMFVARAAMALLMLAKLARIAYPMFHALLGHV